jgi:hypothetical protein
LLNSDVLVQKDPELQFIFISWQACGEVLEEREEMSDISSGYGIGRWKLGRENTVGRWGCP